MAGPATLGGRGYPTRHGVIGRASSKAPIRHLDISLLVSVMLLTALGCVAVRSASAQLLIAQGADPDRFLKRQLVYFSVATVAFVVTILGDYRKLAPYTLMIYGAVLFLLLIVLTPLGDRVSGAQRWIDVGIFQIQPAELMKVAYILLMATVLSRNDGRQIGPISGLAPVIQAMFWAAIPALLIFLQPDLGTASVLFVAGFAALLVSGVQIRWLLLLLLSGLLAITLALQMDVLEDYQVNRLTAFMDTEADVRGTGFNLEQSKIAIGSGGFTGKGWGQGSQTNLSYVPEQRTDFIFTAIGEEKGFLGGLTVLLLFSTILWRCVRTAMLSKDIFGALVASGVAAWFAFQLFVNVGMTIGIMPITGIPLPFVSYGGSSLIASFVGVGLVMNIHMRRLV
ncbi:MAG: rod shape-determining protein RodA [Actinomycetota bacterium]